MEYMRENLLLRGIMSRKIGLGDLTERREVWSTVEGYCVAASLKGAR